MQSMSFDEIMCAAVLALVAACNGPASAQEVKAGIRAQPCLGASNTARRPSRRGDLTIENTGTTPDQLLSGSSDVKGI